MKPDVVKAVLARANSTCECGCRQLFFDSLKGRATLDHFFGRANAEETIETVWALTAAHHADKTDNRPDAATWLGRFLRHCGRNGYVTAAIAAEKKLEWLRAKKELSA